MLDTTTFPNPIVLKDTTDFARHPSIDLYFSHEQRGAETLLFDRALDDASHVRARLGMLASVIRERGGESLLDVGGANGYYSFHARGMGFETATVLDTYDAHREQHAVLARHCRHDAVSFVQGDMERDLPDRTFDTVFALGVLYHLYDHRRFLAEIRERATRYAVIETYAVAPPRGLLDSLGRRALRRSTRPRTYADAAVVVRDSVGDHRSHSHQSVVLTPSLATLLALLADVGFARSEVVPYPIAVPDPYGFGTGQRVMVVADIV